jgi:hypothetical protein
MRRQQLIVPRLSPRRPCRAAAAIMAAIIVIITMRQPRAALKAEPARALARPEVLKAERRLVVAQLAAPERALVLAAEPVQAAELLRNLL